MICRKKDFARKHARQRTCTVYPQDGLRSRIPSPWEEKLRKMEGERDSLLGYNSRTGLHYSCIKAFRAGGTPHWLLINAAGGELCRKRKRIREREGRNEGENCPRFSHPHRACSLAGLPPALQCHSAPPPPLQPRRKLFRPPSFSTYPPEKGERKRA